MDSNSLPLVADLDVFPRVVRRLFFLLLAVLVGGFALFVALGLLAAKF
jgi:hypothetical protein